MKLVTQTLTLAARYGDEKAVEILAKSGFDALDYSMKSPRSGKSPLYDGDTVEYAKKIRAAADANNITFAQAHGAFGFADVEKQKEISIASITAAGILGAEIIVIHPLQHLPYFDNRYKLYDMNMKYYNELIPYCKKAGVKIATENMWQKRELGRERGTPILDSVCASAEEFCKYIDDLNSPYIVGCLDLGHCYATGRKAEDVIRYMGGDRIKALHVHDNDGVGDPHALPKTMGFMDWEEIMKALAEINYQGNFTFEADNFLTGYDDDFLPTALKFMHDTGRYYIKKIESYKKNL